MIKLLILLSMIPMLHGLESPQVGTVARTMMHNSEAAAAAMSLSSMSSLLQNEKPYTVGGTNANTAYENIITMAWITKFSLWPSSFPYRSPCSIISFEACSGQSFFNSQSLPAAAADDTMLRLVIDSARPPYTILLMISILFPSLALVPCCSTAHISVARFGKFIDSAVSVGPASTTEMMVSSPRPYSKENI
nr:hypothetical protein Iba_chr02cCG7660 [Ipomoea batatas]